MQYYEQMLSLLRSTCKNAIFRQLALLTVSGNLPVQYTCSIISQSFHYFELHVKMRFLSASTADSVRESPRTVQIQYYQPIFSLFRSTCKNAIFRQLVLLAVSGYLPRKYTYSIMSQCLQNPSFEKRILKCS
jgi:hypothetical protein